MTISPDLPGFATVDVTQLDITDPSDLVDLGLARAADVLPSWVPREGHPAVALTESFAVIVAALATRLEQVVPDVTAQLLAMEGFPRDAGTPAVVAVEITATDILGHVIPAGTRVMLGDSSVDNPVTGTLDDDVTIAVDETTGTGTVTADTAGTVDGLSTSTPVLLVDVVSYVDTIAITAVTSAGGDPETDAEFLDRGSAYQASLSQVLTLPTQFSARAMTDIRVGRALAVQRWDGTGATPGTVAGAITILVLSTAGVALSGPVMTEIDTALSARATPDLTVTVAAPVVTEVDVTVEVTLLPGHVEATVLAAVEAAITAYLSPIPTASTSGWPWGEAVRLTRLLQVIETTTGVDSATISVPAADVEIDPQDLVKPGTITVTAA